MPDHDIISEGLDFERGGYSAIPLKPTPAIVDHAEWSNWFRVFQAAARGDFTLMAGLESVQLSIEDPICRAAAVDLIGDAGPDSLMVSLQDRLDRLDANAHFDQALDFCTKLRGWGRLDTIPVMLRTWEQIAQAGDAIIIAVYISELLEQHPGPLGEPTGFSSTRAYREAVMARYQSRVDKFGSDRVFVLQGSRFGVNRLVHRIIQQVREPYFPSFLRRSFEASTGLDCLGFFEAGIIQPFVVKRKMEEFLDSPLTENFQDGIRYFFGHAVG